MDKIKNITMYLHYLPNLFTLVSLCESFILDAVVI